MSRAIALFALLTIACQKCLGAVLYDCTLPNPPVAFANLDPGVVMMDDVLIPNARLGGMPRVSIRRLEATLFVPTAGTYKVTTWAAKGMISGGRLQPEFPLTRLATASLTFANPNTTTVISMGTGATEVFSLPVLPFTFQGNGYGLFFFGLSFNAPLQNIGWTLGDSPDVNLDGFYGYYGPGDPRNGTTVLSGYRASFNLKMDGVPVPEPATIAVLLAGICGIVGLRRRKLRGGD